jgi:hypothetical protein
MVAFSFFHVAMMRGSDAAVFAVALRPAPIRVDV